MPKATLEQLAGFGQSIWLDYISRPLMKTGKLQKMIDQGLRGMTSNPTIFHQAISQSADYDEDIIRLAEKGKTSFEIYDDLTIQDIQQAADIFKPVWKSTGGLDGYVSLEINPKLAMNTDESVKEGKRLFQKVDRPNVMIKVPATKAGFPVVEELLSEGINVNVTLIFSLEQYIDTVRAYFNGMSRLAEQDRELNQVISVASIFVSRIDTMIDNLIQEKIAGESGEAQKQRLKSYLGRAAVANCRLIFQKFGELFNSNMFYALRQKGADLQRVLWASTGTKNPQYSDIKYISELILKPTVNTLPEKTIEAFLDHGSVKEAFVRGSAGEFLKELKDFEVDINAVCARLLKDGVSAFEKSFDELLASIENKAHTLCAR